MRFLLLWFSCACLSAQAGGDVEAMRAQLKENYNFLAQNLPDYQARLVRCEYTVAKVNSPAKGTVKEILMKNDENILQSYGHGLASEVTLSHVSIPDLPNIVHANGKSHTFLAQLAKDAKVTAPDYVHSSVAIAADVQSFVTSGAAPVSSDIKQAFDRVIFQLKDSKTQIEATRQGEDKLATDRPDFSTGASNFDCGRDYTAMTTALEKRKSLHERLAGNYFYNGLLQTWDYARRDFRQKLNGKILFPTGKCESSEKRVTDTMASIDKIRNALKSLAESNAAEAEKIADYTKSLDGLKTTCATQN